jgi:hypothetical protein
MPGINETKDVVLAAVALGNAVSKSLEDGKIGISDVGSFVGAVTALPAALAGIGQVKAELADLDDAEKAELLAAVKSHFDIADDKVEAIVEDSLKLVVALHGFVRTHF